MKLNFTIVLLVCFGFISLQSLDALLNKPIDVIAFKKAKGQSNSGGAKKQSYYFKPKQKGFYMSFGLFNSNKTYYGSDTAHKIKNINALYMVTYKPLGKYQDDFIDPNETLIEFCASYNDIDLPQLAFIGLDTVQVKNKLGNNFIRKANCFVYTKNKNALVLLINGKVVSKLKYTRLNLEIKQDNVPNELVTYFPTF